MNTVNVVELLPGYLADELAPDEQALVETALAQSPTLRGELERYRQLQTLLALVALSELHAPPDLAGRVARQVALHYYLGLLNRYINGLLSAYGRALVYYLGLG
ncbi:anti-sigma factor family protein [Kallotenue papyrolyticum]|uniref:anti-sigma factor family protein n=1 Tax=Kallotenue papyrolyticum TaxID=1325125 RepID=UPI00046F9675|nr:zf-HC2 domain-containing protein [Kallotenue papyrolyticum]